MRLIIKNVVKEIATIVLNFYLFYYDMTVFLNKDLKNVIRILNTKSNNK